MGACTFMKMYITKQNGEQYKKEIESRKRDREKGEREVERGRMRKRQETERKGDRETGAQRDRQRDRQLDIERETERLKLCLQLDRVEMNGGKLSRILRHNAGLVYKSKAMHYNSDIQLNFSALIPVS